MRRKANRKQDSKKQMNYWDALTEVIGELFYEVRYYTKRLVSTLPLLIIVATPYLMFMAGEIVGDEQGTGVISSWVFTPIALYILAYLIDKVVRKAHNKTTSCPIPTKRFTEESEDGEINIDTNRLQELIVYMADLENWFERKGLM